MASCRGHLLQILACLIAVSIVTCSKILFINHTPGRSHFNVFEPIINELADRNHDITVHALFKPKTHPNITSIQWRHPQFMDDDLFVIEDEIAKDAVSRMKLFVAFAVMGCEHYLSDDTTKELINKGKQFDVVIIDSLFSECTVAVASLIGKHTVYLSTSIAPQWVPSAVPSPPSYVPNMLEEFTSKMSFCQRITNTYDALYMLFQHYYYMVPAQQALLSKYFPQAPNILEAHEQVVFHLTNADPVIQSPRPSMPNMVHCGGMHCEAAKPLPKDLNDFVESSGDDGFIIFGMGSNVKAKMVRDELQQAAIGAFGRLKQKVIWKFDKKFDNLPKNVKTVDWMPQQDLLGHPKVRVFITHAGLLSLQEAIYHGVPIIPMPLFAEQPGNAARVKELGIGEPISFLNVTADGLYELITKILNDKSYKENMKKYSAVFRDQPERAVDRAVFWIEYVIRHDGARHFRSAGEDLNFFQYFLLDVVAFLSVLTLGAIGIIVYLVKFSLRKLCAKRNSKKDNKKKRN